MSITQPLGSSGPALYLSGNEAPPPAGPAPAAGAAPTGASQPSTYVPPAQQPPVTDANKMENFFQDVLWLPIYDKAKTTVEKRYAKKGDVPLARAKMVDILVEVLKSQPKLSSKLVSKLTELLVKDGGELSPQEKQVVLERLVYNANANIKNKKVTGPVVEIFDRLSSYTQNQVFLPAMQQSVKLKQKGHATARKFIDAYLANYVAGNKEGEAAFTETLKAYASLEPKKTAPIIEELAKKWYASLKDGRAPDAKFFYGSMNELGRMTDKKGKPLFKDAVANAFHDRFDNGTPAEKTMILVFLSGIDPKNASEEQKEFTKDLLKKACETLSGDEKRKCEEFLDKSGTAAQGGDSFDPNSLPAPKPDLDGGGAVPPENPLVRADLYSEPRGPWTVQLGLEGSVTDVSRLYADASNNGDAAMGGRLDVIWPNDYSNDGWSLLTGAFFNKGKDNFLSVGVTVGAAVDINSRLRFKLPFFAGRFRTRMPKPGPDVSYVTKDDGKGNIVGQVVSTTTELDGIGIGLSPEINWSLISLVFKNGSEVSLSAYAGAELGLGLFTLRYSRIARSFTPKGEISRSADGSYIVGGKETGRDIEYQDVWSRLGGFRTGIFAEYRF